MWQKLTFIWICSVKMLPQQSNTIECVQWLFWMGIQCATWTKLCLKTKMVACVKNILTHHNIGGVFCASSHLQHCAQLWQSFEKNVKNIRPKKNINMNLIAFDGHAHKTRDRENVGGATSATELCHCNAKSSLHGKNDVLRPCSIELHFVTLNCKWHSQTQQWQKHWKSALQWLLPNQLVGSENIDDLHCNQEHLTHKPIWMTQVLLNPSWIKWRDLHLINVFFTVFFDLQFAVLACPCAALLSWCGSGEKPPILCQTLQQACVRSATSPWSASSVPVRLWFCSATKNPQKRLTC